MRLSDTTHDYHCSTCRHRGGMCMEALWLGQRVARGLAARASDLPEEFELTSETVFTGCGRACAVLLSVRGMEVEVMSGPHPRDPQDSAARVLALHRAPLAVTA